jgi:hypothetical protein
MRLASFAVAAAVALVVLVGAIAGAEASGEYFTDCGGGGAPLERGSLEAHNLRCPKARKLIIGFMDKSSRQGVTHARVEGFRCKNVPPAIRPGIVCARGGQRARYLGLPPEV